MNLVKKGSSKRDYHKQHQGVVVLDHLPNEEKELKISLVEVQKHIAELERRFFDEEASEDEKKEDIGYMHQLHCIPISIDVRDLNFSKFAK